MGQACNSEARESGLLKLLQEQLNETLPMALHLIPVLAGHAKDEMGHVAFSFFSSMFSKEEQTIVRVKRKTGLRATPTSI